MPVKGYVGIALTPQRKLMMAEIMRAQSLKKPADVLDFAIAVAAEHSNADQAEIEDVNLPDFLNYYVGDASAVTEKGEQGALLGRAQEQKTGVAALFSQANWRTSAFAFVRNCEPTVITMSDAVDFSLWSAILHMRSGTLTDENAKQIKSDIAKSASGFSAELTEFRKENMTDQRRIAEEKGTRRKKKITAKRARTIADEMQSVQIDLLQAYGNWERAMERGSTPEMLESYKIEIHDLKVKADRWSMRAANSKDGMKTEVTPGGRPNSNSRVEDGDLPF